MTLTTLPDSSPDEEFDAEVFDAELPEYDLLGVDTQDPQAAVRFAFLHPECLEPNAINRTFTDEDLADLLASVPVVGFLQAAVVIPIPTDPGLCPATESDRPAPEGAEHERYRVLIGNRRRAVAQRLGRPLPCLIVSTGDSVQEILAILSENDDRLALKPTDKADLYRQLTLLDWTPAQIAKARGVKTAEVRGSLSLVDLPAAARVAADRGQLPLELAADLAEFDDDPKALAKIVEKGKNNTWGYRHAISDERARRDRKQIADRLFAELTLAGIKVTPKPPGFDDHSVKESAASSLRDANGQQLDDAIARTLPGFAAFIEKSAYGGPKVVVYCADPEKYGYTRVGHSQYVSAAEKAQRDAAAAAREALRVALGAAAQVRRDFLVSHYGTARVAKAHQQDALRAAITDPTALTYNSEHQDLADTLAGVAIAAAVESARADRLTRMLVARWVTAAEQNLATITAGRIWRVDVHAAVAYLHRLVEAGYELSDAEQQILTELTAQLAQADDDEDDDEVGVDDAEGADADGVAEPDTDAPDEDRDPDDGTSDDGTGDDGTGDEDESGHDPRSTADLSAAVSGTHNGTGDGWDLA